MSEFITKSDLKDRGWTDSLIKRFLGEPDKTSVNPRYRKAAPMQLFNVERVASVEATESFLQEKSRATARSVVALAVADRRKEETLSKVASLPDPVLPTLDRSELTRRACRHYNKLWLERGQYHKHASPKDAEDFLQRITVNYARHMLTDYERNLATLYNQVGKQDAVVLVRSRVLQAIAKAYPWLTEECAAQNVIEEDAEYKP